MAVAPGVRRSELGDALRACRSAFIGVGVMSCMINLLYLTGSLFMLEVYDRVLPSRSVPTLVGLAILAGGLYIAQGVLDPVKVTRSALVNASSIAGMLLTTETLIVDKPEDEEDSAGAGHGHGHGH